MIYAKNNKIVQLPTRVGNILNFEKQSIEVKNANDYFEVIEPKLKENQKYGNVIDFKDNLKTFEVLDLTEDEIREEKINGAFSVTAIKFLAQLEFEGITEDAILTLINNLPNEQKIIAKISYKRATYFERDNPFIDLIGFAFGKTKEQLDDIFISANNLDI